MSKQIVDLDINTNTKKIEATVRGEGVVNLDVVKGALQLTVDDGDDCGIVTIPATEANKIVRALWEMYK